MMSLVALLLACVVLPGALGGQPIVPASRVAKAGNFPAKYVEQLRDHFDPNDQTTWKQRYFANPAYATADGPVFIMVDGGNFSDPRWITNSFMVEMAEQYGASVYQLEHRYYGDSRPTLTTIVSSLKWLTVQQAVADIAHFIDYLKTSGEVASDATVILFGGGYAGTLAAWARQKYPQLVDAAVASSAPIQLKADFSEYFELVASAIAKTAGQWCVDNIKTAMDYTEQLLTTSQGRKEAKKIFRACSILNLDSANNQNFFFDILADPFSQAVQYNEPTQNGNSDTITDMCSYLKGDNLTAVELANAYGDLLAKRENLKSGSCIPPYSYSLMMFLMHIDLYGLPTEDRVWTYQTCTQLGYYQTGESDKQPFGHDRFPLTFFAQVCGAAYGKSHGEQFMARGINITNAQFGALNPATTRIIFVNGELDPYTALGRTENLNSASPAIVIKGASHCYDMHASDPTDSYAVTSARQQISLYLQKFIDGWPTI